MALSAADKKAYQAYMETRSEIIRNKTAQPVRSETVTKRKERIEINKKDFTKFAKYYCPHYCTSDFGYFHKDAAKNITKKRTIFAVLEWPREHSKSVFANVLLPLFLIANNELDGMVVTSANEAKAIGLLLDLQLELQNNQRFIADFGEQYNFGDWEEGQFTTRNGSGFWALGRGQSPRGLRSQEKRPNYGSIDDIDDDELVRNPERVEQVVDWIEGAFYPAFSTLGARIVVAGNRIARNSVLANLVGDVKDGDKVKPGIYHSKVYALENPRTRKMDRSAAGVPAWKERYTRAILEEKWLPMRNHMVLREYFHQHLIMGKLFKREWIKYVKPLPLFKYQLLVAYVDPSWKEGPKSDYKAIVLLGAIGPDIHLLRVRARQESGPAMATGHYDLDIWIREREGVAQHYIEGKLNQDDHLKHYAEVAQQRGYAFAPLVDERNKPDKRARILDTLQAEFENDHFFINEQLKDDADYAVWLEQLLGFPTTHDDAPDATEGGVWIIKKQLRSNAQMEGQTGGKPRRNNRHYY